MTTATRTKASTELKKLTEAREQTYADLQQVKRDRTDFDAATQQQRAEYRELRDQRPEDHRDAVKNPRAGTPLAEAEAKLKQRLTDPNPHQAAFDERQAEFHRADLALRAFRRERLTDLIGEETDADFPAIEQTGRELLLGIIDWADEYAGLYDRVLVHVVATDGLTGQHARLDPLPLQLKVAAQAALDHELIAPGLTELGEWKVADNV